VTSDPDGGGARTTGNRVLVVDDDAALARALTINLRAHGWDVTAAATGAAALDVVASARPDVVLLDLGLPDMPGLDVIQGIRGWTRVPIVVLSARQLGDDKVDALDAGADDYVTKPFAMNELLARLRAAVRRAAPAQAEEPVVVAGDLRIDLARRQVFRSGTEVRLSPTEWALLEVLVRNRGRLVDRKLLLHEVWGPAYSTETNYLRVYSAQLRRKLEADPSHPRHILTHPGAGYRFEE
jgi:two-component system KDP operon response regulator KdpE